MRTIANINDLHITEMVKLRKYFYKRQMSVVTGVGVSDEDRPYYNECDSALKFLDELILIEFKTLRRDGKIPIFKTQEELDKFADDFYGRGK